MDINKIIAIVEGKEECTKDTLKEIKKVINDFPYFQTGHMLLLKSLHLTDTERYNEQLKISGVFISDKVKLFKFINSSASDLKLEATLKESVQQKTDKNTLSIKSKIDKEKQKETSNKISISDNKKEVNSSKEKSIQDIKVEQKTTQRPKISTPEQKEVKTKITRIKKEPKVLTKVSDDEIYEKSKQQHKKIVKDFFVDPDKEVIIIDETTKQEDIKKLINIPEKSIKNKETEKTVKVSRVEKIKKVKETKKEVESIPKTEAKKDIESKKIIPKIKKEEKETPIKREEAKQIVKTKVQEKAGNTSQTPKKQVDVMNEIFSKIRAIKKEMNIATDENKETIEISPEKKEKTHRIIDKTKEKVKEKERIEKEEFSSKEEETIEKKIEIKEEKKKVPEQIIKEKEIEKDELEEKEDRELTAWDLIKQNQKNKFKKVDKVPSGKSKIEEYLEKQTNNGKKLEENELTKEKTKTETEKIQETITDTQNENINEKQEIIKKETEKEEVIPEKLERKQTEQKEKESAADALLRRIAMKKQQLKEKKEKQEEQPEEKQEDIEEKKQSDVENKDINKAEPEKETTVEKEIKETVEIKEKSEIKEEKTEKKKVKKTQKLIEEFINKADTLERIKPDKEPTIKGDISVKSTVEKDDFITEAMADLYVQQKYYQKAIDAYKKLILKFPQKKTYFAIQIKKVESLIKK